MSHGKDWICCRCGTYAFHEGTTPEGWTAVSYRKVFHFCPACAPPLAGSRFVRRILLWCRCNPALAAMVVVNFVNLVACTLMTLSLASAWRAENRRLVDRIAELELAVSRRSSEPAALPATPVDGR
jgi:hypothetical protein